MTLGRHLLIVIQGKPGMGKSWGGGRIAIGYSDILKARKIEAPFAADNVIFTIPEFEDKISTLPKYSTVMIDDAGIDYSSQDWYSDTVKTMGKILQSFRYLVINVILTCPDIEYLGKHGRELLDIRIDMKKPGMGIAYKIHKNPVNNRIYTKTLAKLDFQKPPEDFIKVYEEKKNLFLRDRWKLDIEKIRAKEARERQKLTNSLPDTHFIDQVIGHLEDFIDHKGNLSAYLIGFGLDIRDHQRSNRLKVILLKHYSPQIQEAKKKLSENKDGGNNSQSSE